MTEPFHKPEYVADLLSVTRDSIYKWVREGKLEAHKFNGCLRIADSELERFISDSKVSPSDPMPSLPPKRGRFLEIVEEAS